MSISSFISRNYEKTIQLWVNGMMLNYLVWYVRYMIPYGDLLDDHKYMMFSLNAVSEPNTPKKCHHGRSHGSRFESKTSVMFKSGNGDHCSRYLGRNGIRDY